MLIYICDDSRADQLRLVHNIESYAKEKGAAVTVKLFSSADALLREYETSTEKPAVIFLDIYMDGTNGMTPPKGSLNSAWKTDWFSQRRLRSTRSRRSASVPTGISTSRSPMTISSAP